MTRYTVRAQGPDGTWKAYVVTRAEPALAAVDAWAHSAYAEWTSLTVEPTPPGPVFMAIDLDEEGDQ